MEAAAPRCSGWISTLRQAAAIKAAPQDWMARADALGPSAGLASLDCASPSPSPSPLAKRTREDFEQREGEGAYGPSTSPSAYGPASSPSAALPGLMVSRGSFQSLDDAGTPQGSCKAGRRRLSPSPSSSMHAHSSDPALLPLVLRRKQEQAFEEQAHWQRQQQEDEAQLLQQEQQSQPCQAPTAAAEEPSPAEEDGAAQQGTVGQFLIELLRSHLAQTFAPMGVAQRLESMLTSSSNVEQRSDAELRQLRHVQNLIWDMMSIDADSSMAPVFAREDGPEASCSSCSN